MDAQHPNFVSGILHILSNAQIIVKLEVTIPTKLYNKDSMDVILSNKQLLLTKTTKTVQFFKTGTCIVYKCECSIMLTKFPIYGKLLMDKDTIENIESDVLFGDLSFSPNFIILGADICQSMDDKRVYSMGCNDGTIFITIDTLPIGG
jgi:hypothetical protein